MIAIPKPKQPKCSCCDRPIFPGKVCANVDGFDRIITFQPGFVCSLTGWGSHGRHGMDMLWMVRKDNKAVHFYLFTNWMPDWEEFDKGNYSPNPCNLGYHSPTPQYEDQTPANDCPWITGPCYSDQTYHAAPAFRVLVSKGEEAMWEYLIDYWKTQFAPQF